MNACVAVLADWCRLALADLAAERAGIDAINVYPVPDSDTGTNLVLTVQAMGEAELGDAPDAGAVLSALARSALYGARGNSGVILAQLLHGAAGALTGVAAPTGDDLAHALDAACKAGYAAVETPVEGTMLTVIRAAAEAATGHHSAEAAVRHAAQAAAVALADTPNQLEPLRQAGVVDAGGRGLVVLLDALHAVLSGERRPAPEAAAAVQEWAHQPEHTPGRKPGATGPAFEVLYLLDAEEAAIPALRRALSPLGDSLVVVGGEGLWNVHIHVDDAGAAIEAGMAAGRPHRIRVTYLTTAAHGCSPGRALVAVAAGTGLAGLFASAGATVVTQTPSRPTTVEEVLDAITATGAADVVVLPNDPDGVALAEQAAARARAGGQRVAVLPTRTQVQGLAACAVHNPGASFDDDVVAMTIAAGHTKHGGVTVARTDALTSAGPCRQGDVLGVVEGDFALVGTDIAEVGEEVVRRLLAGGGELVTVVAGVDAGADVVERVLADARSRPEVDTVVYEGGQSGYPLLIGVE
ncbi:DAK2 domain-containing protein [Flindersiella endophytica]